jgi:NAD-dependent deacetylase
VDPDFSEFSVKSEIEKAAKACGNASRAVALTGAGISVDCGIPDFRSQDGLWSVFDPDEYATLSTFLNDPQKAWRMYRALGMTVQGKEPGAAHRALARLENTGQLAGVITQNIDGLHSAAGSKNVVEIHGDCRSLQCLRCAALEPAGDFYREDGPVPLCSQCQYPLKPNVVLFQEAVRGMDEVECILEDCDLLIVIGTSATVYPAAGFPHLVLHRGGQIVEFNLECTDLTRSCDYFCQGRVDITVPEFVSAFLDNTLS